jgi:hypothetical protein
LQLGVVPVQAAQLAPQLEFDLHTAHAPPVQALLLPQTVSCDG